MANSPASRRQPASASSPSTPPPNEPASSRLCSSRLEPPRPSQPPDPRAMWGIIPAAGHGSRIQPLAFSKELLPVGSRFDGVSERPRAVSEYLVERMQAGGA